MISVEKLRYEQVLPYRWKIPTKIITIFDLDKVCETRESIKDTQIEKLTAENKKLKKHITFLRNEVRALELKTALTAKAVPLEDMVKEVTATPEGKQAWEGAWTEQIEKWQKQMQEGKISRIKFHRLISGVDQKTLADKLGTAQPNISRIERTGYNVPVVTLKKLARIFNVKMGDLVGD